jgi:hypothetical protein
VNLTASENRNTNRSVFFSLCDKLLIPSNECQLSLNQEDAFMPDKPTGRFVDAGRAESEIYEPDEEVSEEFAEAQQLVSNKDQISSEALFELTPSTTESTSDHEAAYKIGEEAIGGFNTTTEDDLVDEMGEAAGLTYQDDEPLHTTEKVEERDRHRWELDPASSEDYQQRVNHEGE